MTDNNNEQGEFIYIPDENGVDQKFEVLYEFDHPESDYRYILLIPPLTEEDNESSEVEVTPIKVKISEAEGNETFELVETEEEWNMIEEVLKGLEDLDEENDDK